MLNTFRLDEFFPSGRYAPVALLTKPTSSLGQKKKFVNNPSTIQRYKTLHGYARTY